MTPPLLNLGALLSMLARLACRVLGHDFGPMAWKHRVFRELHRAMDCPARCLRCGVRCVEVTR